MKVNNKKFFFIFNGYASRNKTITGGETRSITLAKYIYNQGYNVSFCCPTNFHVAEDMSDLNPFYYRTLPCEERFYNFLPALLVIYCYRVFASVFKILKSKSDILISTSHLFPDVLPLFFIKNRNIKSIVIVHHILSEQKRIGLRSKLAQIIEKFCFFIISKRKSYILTLSENTRDMLINKYGFKDKSIYVTKNGLDLKFINSINTPLKKKYDLCFCGRLSMTKGVYDLIKIVKIISNSYPNITCAVVGDGGEKANMMADIKNNKLEDNITMLGFLDEVGKYETIKSSKIFVLPSHEEGWGMVIGEAMACGVPVIVYKLVDILNIWKDNVTWIDCFDKNSFAVNIIELLKNNIKREQYIKKSLNFANKLGWDSILKEEVSAILSNS